MTSPSSSLNKEEPGKQNHIGRRAFYLLVALFFVLMNVLLWRTDILGASVFGSRIAPRLVWEKALTAAGESALEIRYKGAKVGTARWQPNISEAPSHYQDLGLDVPEGMIEGVTSYSIEFDGNFMLDHSTRFRFGLHLKLSTNYVWEEFGLRLALRPHSWEISTVAAEQNVRIKVDDEQGPREQVFKFAELQNSEKLLAAWPQPWFSTLLGSLGVPLGSPALSKARLKWQARNDTLTVQHVRIRGYRLEAKLLDRQAIRIFINPAGEVLRMEFPGDVVLVSEALTNL